MKKRRFYTFSDLDSLSQAAAERVVSLAHEAVAREGRFSLVLAGGSTPTRLYDLLATAYRDRMPWPDTHLFWGDERFVPFDHPASNAATARKHLVGRVPVPPDQVHPIPTDAESEMAAASEYARMIREYFEAGRSPGFDLVLLGLGEDGHTASLFPENMEADLSDTGLVRAVLGPASRPPRSRITLTYTALNQSRHALFLVSGANKRDPLRSILRNSSAAKTLPAARVEALNTVEWFADREAAGGPFNSSSFPRRTAP
jgi:6-phosphogluconolactonase